jgi:hypothetical protein
MFKKFTDWLSKWVPALWGIILIIIFTFGGIGLSIKLIQWVLGLLGVL